MEAMDDGFFILSLHQTFNGLPAERSGFVCVFRHLSLNLALVEPNPIMDGKFPSSAKSHINLNFK
jgi:hypothetical protein